MLEGIDISYWQTVTPSLRGLSFVFVRASVGTAKDSLYDHHAADVRAAGLVLGAYHFAAPTISVSKQAALFLSVAGTADLLALDLEAANMSDAQAKTFIRYVHEAGRKIGIYHSDNLYPSLGQDWRWVANWSSMPTRPWHFWQYTGSPLDHDRFSGDLPALRALCDGAPDSSIGDAMPPLPITDTTPHLVDIPAPVDFYNLDGSWQSGGHSAQSGAFSPFVAGTGPHYYALYAADPANPGQSALILTRPASARDLPPPDCSAAIAEDRKLAHVTISWE